MCININILYAYMYMFHTYSGVITKTVALEVICGNHMYIFNETHIPVQPFITSRCMLKTY